MAIPPIIPPATAAWPLLESVQGPLIGAAIAKYGVPAQVFMGMYNNETSLGTNISTSSAGAIGPFQFTGANNGPVPYPMTNSPNATEFAQQANAAAALLKKNYDDLGHSWTNALGGYEAGAGNYRAGINDGYAGKAMAFQIPPDWVKALGSPAGTSAGSSGSGLGPLGNDTSNFQVGDPTNPDEDYWTAINRISQERYWYVFSDGETLYLADGPDLMKQTPTLQLDRVGDAATINHLEFTFDNTAWNYVATHRRRKRTQRRTALAKVTSPVSAQLHAVCAIDEVRAGDTVVLSNCGPGDGAWLAGDVRRSVFEVTSEIDLVVALTPLTETQLAPPSGLAGTNPANKGTTPIGTLGASGYVNPVRGWSPSRVDMGVDGTLAGNYVAPGDSKIEIADPSSGFWSGGGHVVGRFLGGSLAGKCWFVAEGVSPMVSQGATVAAGTPVASPRASPYNGIVGNIETGWADPNSPGDTLAHATGGYSEGQTTAAGVSFNHFLVGVGAAPGGNRTAVRGQLPAGYP